MSLLRPQPKPVKRAKPRRPLKRSRPMRRKGKTKHARRERDFEYMAWVTKQYCLARLLAVSGNECKGRTEAHHMYGRYVKDADRKTIPLCTKHHLDWTGRVGGRGIFEGWGKGRRWAWQRWSVEYTQLQHTEMWRP